MQLSSSERPASDGSLSRPSMRQNGGAHALALRMASYIKDAAYIQAYVRREFGTKHLPTIETIQQMQADHVRRREAFARDHFVASSSYIPENDNGEHWRPTSFVKMPRPPRPALPNKVRVRPNAVSLVRTIPGEAAGRRIIRMTAEAWGFTVDEMLGPRRDRRVVCARFTAVRLLRNLKRADGSQRFTTPQVAKMIGRNDHSTIIYALQMFGPYRAKYPEMKAIYNLLRRKLG